METEEILKNVIIFDGEKEHSEKEILSNNKLLKFFNTYYVLYFPKSIQKEVITDHGIFYITTNSEYQEQYCITQLAGTNDYSSRYIIYF